MQKRQQPAERRKYIRLNSVFPVEIYLHTDLSSNKTRLIQAFTRDVSLGGLCLSVNDPDRDLLSVLEDAGRSLDVTINMPITHKPIEARVKVAWHELKQLGHRQLLIGVFYDAINPKDKARIISSARRMKWMPVATLLLIIALGSFLVVSDYRAWQLRARNEELIKSFHRAQREAEICQRSIGKMDWRYQELTSNMADNQKLIASLSAQLEKLTGEDIPNLKEEKGRLEESLAVAMAEKDVLVNQLNDILESKEKASKLLDDAQSRRSFLDRETLENMYQWLLTHRNRFTGLVMSYEGDPAMKDWGFTYDQSLASQAFLINDDIEKAGQILSFFRGKAKKTAGGYINAYNVMTGSPAEETVHLGPNIWIGIAAAQYTRRTGNGEYIGLAEDVAGWVISLKDKEGGVRGGPRVTWYSTEHNLDAYALFKMLYGLTKKDIYHREMSSTLRWIKENTYSKEEQAMNRGKGDSTIATDTLAWAIAAMGPARLKEQGMDPDAIMKYAEDHCLVKASFTRPDGAVVEVKGFDFAKSKNIARGGVVSTEWTAQMVISYNIMSRFYKEMGDMDKASQYAQKADFFLGELDKMIISSPSPSGQGAGCLPYASVPNADTGHGWRTPAGAQTGSVAGTAYTIFAKKGYNPLGAE